MPTTNRSYEVLLDFTNDTHDFATVQLLRDYGRVGASVVLLHPGESITLVLDAGSVYKYAVKAHAKVANVTARAWRDVQCDISPLFAAAPPPPPSSGRSHSGRSSPALPSNGVAVDKVWRDNRISMWSDP